MSRTGRTETTFPKGANRTVTFLSKGNKYNCDLIMSETDRTVTFCSHGTIKTYDPKNGLIVVIH